MEPYRPFVDQMVLLLVNTGVGEISQESKKKLLQIPVLDVHINQQRSPLMLAVQQTAASLQQCYTGKRKTLKLPSLFERFNQYRVMWILVFLIYLPIPNAINAITANLSNV